MKQVVLLLFCCIFSASCQNKNSTVATEDNSLHIKSTITDCQYVEYPTYTVNKNYVVFQECKTRKIFYPDVASFRKLKYDRNGIAFDKNGVYIKGELVKTDTAGFVLLAPESNKKAFEALKNWLKGEVFEKKNITNLYTVNNGNINARFLMYKDKYRINRATDYETEMGDYLENPRD